MARFPAVSLSQLRTERMLLLKEGHCFRDSVLTACAKANLELHSVFESDQFASIFPLVAAGYGISLIPSMAASLRLTGNTVNPLAAYARTALFPNLRRSRDAPRTATEESDMICG